MIDKVSKRINQLIQSQQQNTQNTPTKSKANKQFDSTPPKSKNSSKLDISHNMMPIISQQSRSNNNPVSMELYIQDPLNRTRSMNSEQKLLKQFGSLIEFYKTEIINMIQPLITAVQNKLISRMNKIEKKIKQIIEDSQYSRNQIVEPQFTLAANSKRSNHEQREIEFSIMELVKKAQNIQETLIKNNKSVYGRLDIVQKKLDLVVEGERQRQKIGYKVKNKCNCEQFLEGILTTQASLAQEIKFIKHQIQKIVDKKS